MEIKPVIVLAAIVATIAAATPVPAGGCRQIHEASDIFEPGCYQVTRPIVAAGPPALTISVENDEAVVIDLCGHKLTQSTTATPVISVSSAGSVELKNGSLEGGNAGFNSAFASANFTLSNLDVSSAFGSGVDIDGARNVTIEDSNLEFFGSHAIDVSNSNSLTVRRTSASHAGGNGINSVANREVAMNDVKLDDTLTGVAIDNVGINDSTAVLRRMDASNTAFGYRLRALKMVRLNDIGARETDDSAIHLLDTSGGSFEDISLNNIGGSGIKLENSNGLTGRKVQGVGIGGSGLIVDANSRGNFLEQLRFVNTALDALAVEGADNWFDAFFSNEPGGCPVHFGANSSRNLVRLLFANRSAGPCSCAGVLTGDVCDEGQDNLVRDEIF